MGERVYIGRNIGVYTASIIIMDGGVYIASIVRMLEASI
jgi:hypothetical protein